MKALRLDKERPILPYGEDARAVPVGNVLLAEAQERALMNAGVDPVREAPDEPYIVYESNLWFTSETVRRVAKGEPGRLFVDDERFWAGTGALQRTSSPGSYGMALHPGGDTPLEDLPLTVVDLGLEDMELPELHPRLRHAVRPVRVGPAMVHAIDHWTHILRVNQLALAAEVSEGMQRWEQAGVFRKAWTLGALAWRAGGLREDRVRRALSKIHPTAKIHPSAVVETSDIGAGVEIGPMAVVRSSKIGEGCRIEEHATVVMSTLGDGCHIGRYGLINLCMAWTGARISHGDGFQNCLFGRDAFVAWGATVLDLSFGKPIEVESSDGRVSSGQHFLGAAIGHEAVLGNAVRVNHGMSIPNGVTLIGDGAGLLRRWGESSPYEGARFIVRNGVAEAMGERANSAGNAGDTFRAGFDDALFGDDSADE